MVSKIRIKDYALMEELSVGFDRGLNILTGETGAGKSIIVGALGLALGEKSDSGAIRTGKDSAEVEAVFDLSSDKSTLKRLRDSGIRTGEGQIALRRVVQSSGRSRCFLNGDAATLADLRRVSDLLVDIHGQHQHQALLRPDSHITFLDGFAGLEGDSEKFGELFDRLNGLKEEIERREKEAERLRQTEELYRFQKSEIESARLGEGEEESLESERRVLENSEKLLLAAGEAYEALYEAEGSASEIVASARRRLEEISSIDDAMKPHLEEISSVSEQLDELCRAIDNYRNTIHHDPQRLEEVRSRLDVIHTLKKKYGGSVASVLEYGDHIGTELKKLDRSSTDVSELKAEADKIEKEMSVLAGKLSKKRSESAKEFEQKVARELGDLNMSKCEFVAKIDREKNETGPAVVGGVKYTTFHNGIDRVEFLFSANPGEPAKPLARIASGGETSRVMLALKSILSDVDRVGTLIFDEVDIGIGGRVAESVGKKLRTVAKTRQVICITHLPQIAVQGSTHYAVKKEVKSKKTFTSVDNLDSEERVMEIARMLGGKKITDTTVNAAREMLNNAG